MSITQRSDIRRRALRAAAQVAMLGGAGLACGTTPLEQLQAQAPDPEDAGVARAEGQAVDAGVIVVGDAGVVPDTGLDSDASLVDGGEFCDQAAMTPDDYLACCERVGWNWDQGCAAWGPPAPPEVA
ncbi:MAG: hypothetical protein H6730_28405 [Deltaproteobacteria bacterium]|nr:hypothetical protein [Deltaproteobacteria bacterium]